MSKEKVKRKMEEGKGKKEQLAMNNEQGRIRGDFFTFSLLLFT
jgi:hypothetical protein